MIQFWITILLLVSVTYADVSHLQNHYEPQYNLEPAATHTHRPIYTIPPTRYDQVVAASSQSERYSYDPPASQFNPYVSASERKSTYAAPPRDYYQSAASAPTVYAHDNKYNYNGKQDQFGSASALRPTYATSGYSGRPTYAGYQHTASSTYSKPIFSTPQGVNTLKPTYAGYQPISASSENRRPTYAGYEPAPAASQRGYEYSVAAPSYKANVYTQTPSYNSRRTSYQAPTSPTLSQLSLAFQKNTYTQAPTYPTTSQMRSGQYNHQSTKNGQYNHQAHKSGQYQHQTTRNNQYQPQASVQKSYYSQAPTRQTYSYQTAASEDDSTVVKSDGYHYDKPAIPFDPAPIRTPDTPSQLYEDAPPPPPVRRPTNPPPQYRQNDYYTPPTQAPHRYNPIPTPPPVRFNPAPVVRKPTYNTVPVTSNIAGPPTTSIERVQEIEEIINTPTTPSPPLVRITPRTTPKSRTTPHPIVNTTPYIVTFPPPKVSDVVLLAYSASTISPNLIIPDVYSPPPDVSATVRSVKKVSDQVIENRQADFVTPAPFVATKPVNPIRRPQRAELETSASEDQFQYLPPESPTFGGLRDDGYHYHQPDIPFY